jgi:glycogen debranching enzyme
MTESVRPGSPPIGLTAPVQRATDLTGVLILKHEDRFLLTDAFGDIHPDRRGLGLYRGDTRLVSHYELRLNGQRPVVLRTSGGGSYVGSIQLTNPDLVEELEGRGAEVVLRRHSLGILRDRLIADGFREAIAVDNFTMEPQRCCLTLRFAADFADIFEVRGIERDRGPRPLAPIADPDRIVLASLGEDGALRRTHVALSEPATRIPGPDVLLEFDWSIPPGGQRRLEVVIWDDVELDERRATEEARRLEREATRREDAADRTAAETAAAIASFGGAPWEPAPLILDDVPATAHRSWTAGSASVTTGDEVATRALRRALADLRALVSPGPADGERYIAAGIPWFACLFGRDSIVTALELLAIRPQVAVETLELLARLQATASDDWHDAEPGKIMHELRTGELARAGEIPYAPYYGSVDATPLWLILLGETYAWTGDTGLVDRLWPNALAALRWIDEFGDLDGDGFVEYRRRSRRGLVNHGWKGSPEAYRYRDGRLADTPLALVEVQGYVYAARRHMARLARGRGDAELADRQDAAAETLRARFEEAFWVEDSGMYAIALDPDKRPVDAIASNAGHALWTGIASPDHATRVAATLAAPGMWSGWGVRTLSAETPGYNPIGYTIGAIWPHDNAIVAAGLARYGFRDQAALIGATMLEATRHFRDARVPELFCGFDRATSPFPVPYPLACQPQAWAAASLFSLVGTMLGMRADAAAGQLEFVSPTVPEWLRDVRIENLRVGGASVDLLFHRSDGSTSVEVLNRIGDLTVIVRV